MKRIGYLLEKIADIENLNIALKEACRRKKDKPFVKEVLANKDLLIQKLHDELLNGTLELSPNKKRTIYDRSSGKIREITIPAFYPDQIVHWAVCLVLKPIIMRGMYHYCCGSVPRRGGIYGKRYIDKIFRNDRKVKYAMKLDIRKFFPTVSNDKMKALFRTKIKDKRTLSLLDAIIDNGGQGLPIGYYTSQWFSNFYLEKLDHFIKEELHIRHYERNVDDMVLIDTNKRKLHKALRRIIAFLDENGYNCVIKGNWQVWPIDSRPINFLGFLFYRDKTLLRKYILRGLKRSIGKIQTRGYCTVARARGIASRLGYLKQIPHGKHFYLTYIKPVISKGELSRIISKYDKLKHKGAQNNGYTRQNRPVRGTA